MAGPDVRKLWGVLLLLFCAVTIHVRCTVRTSNTLFLYYSTAQKLALLRPNRELSVIDGRILFLVAKVSTFLIFTSSMLLLVSS